MRICNVPAHLPKNLHQGTHADLNNLISRLIIVFPGELKASLKDNFYLTNLPSDTYPSSPPPVRSSSLLHYPQAPVSHWGRVRAVQCLGGTGH